MMALIATVQFFCWAVGCRTGQNAEDFWTLQMDYYRMFMFTSDFTGKQKNSVQFVLKIRKFCTIELCGGIAILAYRISKDRELT